MMNRKDWLELATNLYRYETHKYIAIVVHDSLLTWLERFEEKGTPQYDAHVEITCALIQYAEEVRNIELYELIAEIDPVCAALIHMYKEQTGMTPKTGFKVKQVPGGEIWERIVLPPDFDDLPDWHDA